MEQLPDGAHVRLRSRVHSTYIRADVDMVGISLSPYRGCLHTEWTVRRVVRGGVAYLVFHGAAYGTYIALCPEVTGQRIVQRICDALQDDIDILWVAIEPSGAAAAGAANVLLRHGAHDAYLVIGIPEGHDSRSNQWLVEVIPHPTSSLYHRELYPGEWEIELVAPRARPPLLPEPSDKENHIWRNVLYILGDDYGNYDQRG